MNKKNFVRTLSLITCLAVFLSLAILYFVFRQNIMIASVISFVFVFILLIIFYTLDNVQQEAAKLVEKELKDSTKQVLNFGELGILIYNDEYEITWMSELFKDEEDEHIGEKLLNWLPETQELLEGIVNKAIININDETYEICRIEGESILIFKDITDLNRTNKKLNDDAYVLGMIGYDNFDEYQETEDELAFVNTNIKIPVMDYFRKYDCILKTLKNDKLLLILSEKSFKKIIDDRFSILTAVRKVSNDSNLDITLSIAFARGTDNLDELDNAVSSSLELAQIRGGDQVVVKNIGGDTTFFGGTSEAREKQNMTKVRVMINSIKDLISKSDKVIIVGHKDADADCIGSAICVSNICLDMEKDAYIVSKTGGIEPMINEALENYRDIIYEKHKLISEDDALGLLDDNTLVIMVDHHSLDQSNSAQLLKKAKRVIIIDHHRRKEDLEVNPLMYYIEASASSTCELTCEFLPYMSRKLVIEPEEANIMYIGLMIDTDHFRVRTGARTFGVARQLRRYGANPLECDRLIEEPYENVMDKVYIISQSKQYKKDIIISSVKDKTFTRSIASQACDEMISSREIESAFVICDIGDNVSIITARSKGNFNVQTILEKMNGGGHMSAAGLQRKDTSVDELEEELTKVLDEYFEEEIK